MVRYAESEEEKALLTAVWMNDVKKLTSLLQKGVCPNLCDDEVCCFHEREMIFAQVRRIKSFLGGGRCEFLSPNFGCDEVKWLC